MKHKPPGVFEREVAELEERLMLTTLEQGGRLGAVEVDVAGHVRARLLRDRDDVDRLGALRHRPLRDGGIPGVSRARPTC